MMDREQFTSAVLAAEPTLYRVAKTMLRAHPAPQRACLCRRGAAGNPAGLGAAGFAAQHAVFQNVAGPHTHQRVQHDIAPSAAACVV